jgi:hypothetical protein
MTPRRGGILSGGGLNVDDILLFYRSMPLKPGIDETARDPVCVRIRSDTNTAIQVVATAGGSTGGESEGPPLGLLLLHVTQDVSGHLLVFLYKNFSKTRCILK